MKKKQVHRHTLPLPTNGQICDLICIHNVGSKALGVADCSDRFCAMVRLAFTFLDQQKKTKKPSDFSGYGLKHVIEYSARTYVSTTAVSVAALMHPDIIGSYPDFNISKRLTLPNYSTLSDGLVGKHSVSIDKSMELLFKEVFV